MSILFDPMKIGNMALRNRFVRSATYDGYGDSRGHVTEKQVELLSDLAEGGVGLIITGIAYVHPSGQRFPVQNSIASDDCIQGFKRLTNAVHDRGAKIAVQLYHAGRARAIAFTGEGEEALAPSFVNDDPYFEGGKYRPMTENEIGEIVIAFGDAARRAREANFDAVQIHGAHGYLLSQFLSPFTNHRTDDWGGPLENRLRFHYEICREIREKVGADYPLLIKIGVQDGIPGGLEFKEGKKAAQLLARRGFDALEISIGLNGKDYENTEFRTGINRPDREAYYRTWTSEIKAEVNVPVMMVGGLRSFEIMEEVVQKNETDFISLCRPLIREPRIINDWKSGDLHRTTCISCNKCLEGIKKGSVLNCGQQKL
jgi:2,4-dienoyl-CoA reductase-like NADH-dependent reductase (Old Yellow Enzyme family)